MKQYIKIQVLIPLFIFLGLSGQAAQQTIDKTLIKSSIKKMKLKSKIPSADTSSWVLVKNWTKDKVQLIRYRPDLKSYFGNSNYPKRLVIIWDYEVDTSSGMPSNQLSNEMRAMEDALVEALDSDRIAILSFVLTNYGSREWHFYANNMQEINNRINLAFSHLPKLPIHLQVEDDPNWEELRAVYSISKDAN